MGSVPVRACERQAIRVPIHRGVDTKVWYTYTKAYCSAIKNLTIYDDMGVTEGYILSEINQRQIPYDFIYMRNPKNRKNEQPKQK